MVLPIYFLFKLCEEWPHWEEVHLVLLRLDVLGWVGTHRGPPFSEEKGRGEECEDGTGKRRERSL